MKQTMCTALEMNKIKQPLETEDLSIGASGIFAVILPNSIQLCVVVEMKQAKREPNVSF